MKINRFSMRLFFFRDFKVAMINLNDDTNKMKYFDGHQAPILALNVYEEKRWIVRNEILLNEYFIFLSGNIVL
jgi:hypothetical protein